MKDVVRVRIQHLYEDDRVETFQGTARVVRALILLRYAPLLRWTSVDDATVIIDQLSRVQILSVTFLGEHGEPGGEQK